METFLHDLSWVLPLRSGVATPVFEAFTWAGYTTFYILLLAIGYWALDKTAFARLAVLIGLSAVLNSFLKDFWQDPRPDAMFRMDHAVGESFGMPSGHAQISFVTWVFLALSVQRAWAWVLAGIMVLGIAFSRLYLGVHDVEDILAGWAIGIVSLAAFVWFIHNHLPRWHARHWSFQLLALAALHAVMWFLWPGGPNTAFALGGLLLGWWIAIRLDRSLIHYAPRPEWWARGASAAIGIVGLFVLSMIWTNAAKEAGMGDIAVGYGRSLLIALYIGVIAPPLFQMLSLARKETP